MKNWLVGALALLAADAACAAGSPHPAIESSGDALLVAMPIAALGLTFLLSSDHDGADKAAGYASFDGSSGLGTIGGFDFVHMTGSPRHDLGLALLRTEVVSFGLKAAVNEDRPNGEPHSFPSAHTSTTFMAAEFIRKEYGWQWGLPAYLAASYAGWTRVAADEHYTHDVAAGALIGVLSNHDFGEIAGFRIQPSLLGFTSRFSGRDQPSDGGVAPGVTFETHFGK